MWYPHQIFIKTNTKNLKPIGDRYLNFITIQLTTRDCRSKLLPQFFLAKNVTFYKSHNDNEASRMTDIKRKLLLYLFSCIHTHTHA